MLVKEGGALKSTFSLLPTLCFLPGDFTLDINPVTLEDDATFQCQVSNSSMFYSEALIH